MKETEVILCDADRDFAQRLIVFLRRRDDHRFSIHYYRDFEEMEADRPLGDHLLIETEQYGKMIAKKDGTVYAGKVHVLCANRADAHAKGSIYKYQSAKEILKELNGEEEKRNPVQDVLSNDRKARLKDEIVKRLSRQRQETEEEVYRVIDTCLMREN
ncbi:MAG: hypothetical protein IKS87_08210, partial [Lachnospiraceae bacterium]|nr:hypothetical protein [Lachnospiraceae bacterium]